MHLRLEDAIRNAAGAGEARLFPTKEDRRVRDGAVFPRGAPRFSLAEGTSLFTIGSCFARSLEENLTEFDFPTCQLAVAASERTGRTNGILNEYNPGTMCQRVEHAASGESFGNLGIAEERDGYLDLLLPAHVTPVRRERLLQRRDEVDAIYGVLSSCRAVVVSLDLIEAWFDNATGLYLNRIPPPAHLLADRDRFELHVLEVHDVQLLLERMLAALRSVGVTKVVVTVSPTPMEVTYSGRDCVIANAHSKSVLVVTANELCRRHADVDYFPSYEIATSAGPAFYESDGVHVRPDAEELLAKHLAELYTA